MDFHSAYTKPRAFIPGLVNQVRGFRHRYGRLPEDNLPDDLPIDWPALDEIDLDAKFYAETLRRQKVGGGRSICHQIHFLPGIKLSELPT